MLKRIEHLIVYLVNESWHHLFVFYIVRLSDHNFHTWKIKMMFVPKGFIGVYCTCGECSMKTNDFCRVFLPWQLCDNEGKIVHVVTIFLIGHVLFHHATRAKTTKDAYDHLVQEIVCVWTLKWNIMLFTWISHDDCYNFLLVGSTRWISLTCWSQMCKWIYF